MGYMWFIENASPLTIKNFFYHKSFFKGLLGVRKSQDGSTLEDTQTHDLSSPPRPLTLMEVQENISRLPKVKNLDVASCF